MRNFDLGILGGGQLARMSILAAHRLGMHCLSLDSARVTPASQVAPSLQGGLDDPEKIAHVINQCDAITLENEFIRAETIQQALVIAGRDETCLTPGIATLATIQDKLFQRDAYAKFGAPSPRAVPIERAAELGYPVVLKARFGGYDGKGTAYAKSAEEFESHRPRFEQGGWMAEEFVPFRRELAVMVYRTRQQTGCFPTMETVQVNHVCSEVFPSGVDASEAAIAAVEAVDGYGLFGVELFELEDGSVLINEIAPRPHNSGHYSLDWGGVSQFEQHARLACGIAPANATGQAAAMANILGPESAGAWESARDDMLARHSDCFFHWYGKAESRAGRKMGHVNAVGEDCRSRAASARDAFLAAWRSGP